MLGRKIGRLAPVILVLALVGCDRGWRLDATLSVDVRDAELREWLQNSHVEFWDVCPGEGLSAYDVRHPADFDPFALYDPGDLLPLFDGPTVRSAKWDEQEGVFSARFTNCGIMTVYLACIPDYRPIFRIVPAVGDAEVLFLAQNKENEAVWAVAKKVSGSCNYLHFLGVPAMSDDTLIGWDGEHHYELVGPKWYTSMKLTHEVGGGGDHVTFHVQIPHPDIPEKTRTVE